MQRPSSRAAALSFLIVFIGVTPRLAHAQTPVRLGPELQVNTYVTERQDNAEVAVTPSGAFVVVWQSVSEQDGDESGVFARRYDSGGSALATEFQISVATLGIQGYPSIAADGAGGFVVVWTDGFVESGGAVIGRRFNSNGTPQSGEMLLNAFFTGSQGSASVASAADGDFVVVWVSSGQDGGVFGVFGRQFTSSGAPLATEFQVNTYTIGYQLDPTVALDADDDFVVAWRSVAQDGDQSGVFARRFGSNGATLASEFQVSGSTIGYQGEPFLAGEADGDFIVAFTKDDGGDVGVFARRFDSAGTPLAVELQINVFTETTQTEPWVAIDADGDFVVAFQSNAQDGSDYAVFARRFSSAGNPLGLEFQVNTHTQSYQSFPAVDSAPNGDFVVVWTSYGQDTVDSGGVFAQRFGTAAAVLDVDGNGATGALTDGLLVLRYLFSFTGPTLISGATGAGCTRCDSPSIVLYLDGLGLVLDADDNDSLSALTDGLLILRFLFGFTGTTLATGATGPGCMRCDSAAILPYLQTLD